MGLLCIISQESMTCAQREASKWKTLENAEAVSYLTNSVKLIVLSISPTNFCLFSPFFKLSYSSVYEVRKRCITFTRLKAMGSIKSPDAQRQHNLHREINEPFQLSGANFCANISVQNTKDGGLGFWSFLSRDIEMQMKLNKADGCSVSVPVLY